MKNLKHTRQAVAKLQSGNHSFRIKSGRHYAPIKLPDCLRICQPLVALTIFTENKNHFLLYCDYCKTIKQQITSDIVLKGALSQYLATL